MDLPAGPVQDYIRLAGICAIYVASFPSGTCQVGVSCDLRRTQTMLRRQGQDLTYVAAFWTNDRKLATKIVNKVNKTSFNASLTAVDTTARITATAEKSESAPH